jgi:hypothetical protein
MEARAKEGVDRWNGAPWIAPIGFKLNLEF